MATNIEEIDEELSLIVEWDVKPGHMEDALKAISKNGRISLDTEPGVLQWDVVVPFDEENKIFLYERYANGKAYAEHMRTPQVEVSKDELGSGTDRDILTRRRIVWCRQHQT